MLQCHEMKICPGRNKMVSDRSEVHVCEIPKSLKVVIYFSLI